jgi:hypothetical protein
LNIRWRFVRIEIDGFRRRQHHIVGPMNKDIRKWRVMKSLADRAVTEDTE